MAITHANLSLKTNWRSDIGRRLPLFLIFLSVICGLFSFVLCLAAEASRSEATWYMLTKGDSSKTDVCVYSRSGRTPLAYAVCAFLLLAAAMFTEHVYMLVAAMSPPKQPAAPVAQTPPLVPRPLSSTARTLTWQACCLLLTVWICFVIAEVLLIIGIGVESGHISQWRKPKPSCHVIRPGLFAAAGIFGLITVLLGVGLYLTALQMLNRARDTPPPPPPPSAPPQTETKKTDSSSA